MPRFTDPQKLINHLKKDLVEARAKAIAKVDAELDRVIESPSEFADLGFDGQDIVDTSRLLKSKIITADPNGVTFGYDPVDPDSGYHYAAAVYFGFFAFGKKYIPGRRWTIRSVKNENPVLNMVDSLKGMGYDARVALNNIPDLEG